jgi:predicted LPLAT superfamily acyltransferase
VAVNLNRLLVAMTLRLSTSGQEALQRRAAAEEISMQEAARRTVREYVARAEQRDRAARSAAPVPTAYAETLERLGR